ncbi:MAG: hypothetical protein GF383_15400 [Candidatus Lokiarchaeota archaeon]|nr:hypothetical protein [Candidatus Lokiarchaeota archaeon]MBD3342929.1 hypothetical protein [Candidatus Lokiarchaeota archaeon]
MKISRQLSGLCGIIAGIQFIVLTIIAMVIFPGGYIFWEHFFSNLGCIRAYEPGGITESRGLNDICRIIFIITCTSAAIFIIPFILGLNSFFSESKLKKKLSNVGTLFAILAAPNLSLLAIYPGDGLHGLREAHVLTTQLFFIFYGISIMIFSAVFLIDKDYENFYGFIGVFIAVLLILYAFIFLYNAAFQKITVYSTILWSVIQGIKLWNSA